MARPQPKEPATLFKADFEVKNPGITWGFTSSPTTYDVYNGEADKFSVMCSLQSVGYTLKQAKPEDPVVSGHALAWSCCSATTGATKPIRAETWWSPKYTVSGNWQHYVADTNLNAKLYFENAKTVSELFVSPNFVTGTAWSLGDGDNFMNVQALATEGDWTTSGAWGYRLTSDTDAKLLPLKIGDSVSFKAGGRTWKGAKNIDILSTSTEPKEMSYTLIESGALALMVATSTAYYTAAQLF